ncbi:MAG: transcription termination factor NusA [Lachnospirales bacterium]
MKNSKELIKALDAIESEKGIKKEIVFEAIESSLVTACKKHYGNNYNAIVNLNKDTGDIKVYLLKTVVEEVEDKATEINLEDAIKISKKYILGDTAEIEVTTGDFGRISAQTAKQVVTQKIREAEREILYDEYIMKEKEVVTGLVQRRDRRNIVVQIGKLDAYLLYNEQIRGEKYTFNERLKVYVMEVKKTSKGPVINVSRTHPELVKRLFEEKVSEVHDGVVEIKSVSREAGARTKMAVFSKDKNVDAVGACVGANGIRVNQIVEELKGEKIDIINWYEDPKYFIAASLSPSEVLNVLIDEENRISKVIVPDDQLSLAIGKEGQNARLAVKLTNWKIDIKSETKARETNFMTDEELITSRITEEGYKEALMPIRRKVENLDIEALEIVDDLDDDIEEERKIIDDLDDDDIDIDLLDDTLNDRLFDDDEDEDNDDLDLDLDDFDDYDDEILEGIDFDEDFEDEYDNDFDDDLI